MPAREEPARAAAPGRRLAAVVAMALMLLSGGAVAAAQKDQGGAEKDKGKKSKQEKAKSKQPAGPPKLDAKAWILVDPLDGEVLASSAPERERPIASTTKLMTAYLALKRLDPQDKLKFAPYDAAAAESVVGIPAGTKVTVKDLLYALLLPSANDAAETLAVGISGSEKKFVAEMNAAAETLGLDHTHYANPIGLDEEGNYSSAQDLVTLANELLANDLFARIVDTPEATLKVGSTKVRISTRNTLLLTDPTVTGVKTGHTIEAGYVLVASAKRNGTTLVSAVLGTRNEETRDAETQELLDYGFSQYRALTPIRKGEELADPKLDYRSDHLSLVAKRDVPVSIRKGQRVKTRVSAPDEVEGPIKKGKPLGRVVVTVDGRVAGASPLVAATSADEASLLDKAIHAVARPIALIPVGLIVIVVGLLLAFRGRGGEDEPEAVAPPAAAPAAPAPSGSPAEAPEAPQARPRAQPPAPAPEATEKPEDQPKRPKGRRLRRERKPKGPPQRTPEERRQMAIERARRRKGRGR